MHARRTANQPVTVPILINHRGERADLFQALTVRHFDFRFGTQPAPAIGLGLRPNSRPHSGFVEAEAVPTRVLAPYQSNGTFEGLEPAGFGIWPLIPKTGRGPARAQK